MIRIVIILLLTTFIFTNTTFAYRASSLKREINYIQSDIKQAQRKINSIKYSNKISEHDKKDKSENWNIKFIKRKES